LKAAELTSQASAGVLDVTYYNAVIVTENHLSFVIGDHIATLNV